MMVRRDRPEISDTVVGMPAFGQEPVEEVEYNTPLEAALAGLQSQIVASDMSQGQMYTYSPDLFHRPEFRKQLTVHELDLPGDMGRLILYQLGPENYHETQVYLERVQFIPSGAKEMPSDKMPDYAGSSTAPHPKDITALLLETLMEYKDYPHVQAQWVAGRKFGRQDIEEAEELIQVIIGPCSAHDFLVVEDQVRSKDSAELDLASQEGPASTGGWQPILGLDAGVRELVVPAVAEAVADMYGTGVYDTLLVFHREGEDVYAFRLAGEHLETCLEDNTDIDRAVKAVSPAMQFYRLKDRDAQWLVNREFRKDAHANVAVGTLDGSLLGKLVSYVANNASTEPEEIACLNKARINGGSVYFAGYDAQNASQAYITENMERLELGRHIASLMAKADPRG